VRARQFAPLYDGGAIKLTARAVRKVSNDYKFRLELCAHALSLPATIADLVDVSVRQLNCVFVVRAAHCTARGCLLRPGATRNLHTDASGRRALRHAALKRLKRKVQG